MMTSWQELYVFAPDLLYGVWLTIQLTLISSGVAIILGTVCALAQVYGARWMRVLVQAYVGLIRGTPMLVQMVAFFFIVPYTGLILSAFFSAVVVIGVHSAAYISQTLRAGLMAVGAGQYEAAQVLGFSHMQTIRFVMLPQALRISMSALGNEVIALIKNSSLASVIGVAELTHQGSFMMSRTYDALTTYCILGILYFVITSCVSYVFYRLEGKRCYVAD